MKHSKILLLCVCYGALAFMSGCSSTKTFQPYAKTDEVSVKLIGSGKEQALYFTNEDFYNSTSGGAKGGAAMGVVAGGLLALPCGPFWLLCFGYFGTVGAISGGLIGYSVGALSSDYISDEDKLLLENKLTAYFRENDPHDVYLQALEPRLNSLFVIAEGESNNQISMNIERGFDYVGDDMFSFVLFANVEVHTQKVDSESGEKASKSKSFKKQRKSEKPDMKGVIPFIGQPIHLKDWLTGDKNFHDAQLKNAYEQLAYKVYSALSGIPYMEK